MRLKDSRFGMFYGCIMFPRCRATHGAHPDGAPLGVPANQETKTWRIKAHAAFDDFWHGKMRRGEAYKWLQQKLGLSADECHIGMFNVERCKRVIEVCAGARL